MYSMESQPQMCPAPVLDIRADISYPGDVEDEDGRIHIAYTRERYKA